MSWDAPGIDNLNPNGEWVVVRNIGTTSVDISGLAAARLEPDVVVLLPTRQRSAARRLPRRPRRRGTNGSPDPHDLYMNSTEPIFPNTTEAKFLGDGAYLLDHATAIRFYDEYPCLANCSDPLQGDG